MTEQKEQIFIWRPDQAEPPETVLPRLEKYVGQTCQKIGFSVRSSWREVKFADGMRLTVKIQSLREQEVGE